MQTTAFSLIGIDGNAFSVMGYVRKAMRRSGYSKAEIDTYTENAQSKDYNHLLNVSRERIEILNAENGLEEDDD